MQMLMMLPLFKKFLAPTRRRRRAGGYNTTRNGRCKAGYQKKYVCVKKKSCTDCKPRKRYRKGIAGVGMKPGERYVQTGSGSYGKRITGRAGRFVSAGDAEPMFSQTQSSMQTSIGTSADLFSQSGCNI